MLVCARVGAADAPFLWRVTGPHATHYLMGSVHLLPSSVYPLPGAFDRAYEQSTGLLLETDIAALNQPAAQITMLSAGTASGGIAAEIGTRLYQRVQAHLTDIGMPGTLCDRFKAWLCAVTLGVLEFQKAGMAAGLGLDQHFFDRARKEGKVVRWLETTEQQMTLFSGMSEDMGERFLESSIEDLQRAELKPEALIKIWRSGDTRALDKIVAETRRDFPQIHARLLAERNLAWIGPLRLRFDDDQSWLVVVGAAHLVGSDGLIALLPAYGYRIEAVNDSH